MHNTLGHQLNYFRSLYPFTAYPEKQYYAVMKVNVNDEAVKSESR